jgi:aminopeptidase N
MKGTAQIFQLKDREEELVFDNMPEPPAFASMNRDYSFYGTFRNESADTEILRLQALLDTNAFNRVDAMRQLTDIERIKLLRDPGDAVGSHWVDLYGEILSDKTLPSSIKAYFLRIDEQPMDREYSTWYQELVIAREKLMSTVNRHFRPQLLEEFQRLDTYSVPSMQSPNEGIENRMLKNVLLDLIVINDSAESQRIILDHFKSATKATDRIAALMALNRSSSSSRRPLLEEVYEKWHAHLSGYANYLRVVSSGTREDVFEMIEKEKKRRGFDITQPTWCRALFLPMALNNKMVWTDQGISWVADTVIELAPINATTTGRLLNTFQHVRKLKKPLQDRVLAALERIVRNVDKEACPAVYGQASAYLKGV